MRGTYHGIDEISAWLVSRDTHLGETEVDRFLADHDVQMTEQTAQVVNGNRVALFAIRADGTVSLEK